MATCTVCVLLYGGDEHAWLHQRCLASLRMLPRDRCHFRLGLNAVTAESTQALVSKFQKWAGVDCELFQGENIGKYPRMREMLKAPHTARHIMWFDDDSYLRWDFFEKERLDVKDWFDGLTARLDMRPGILGSVYYKHMSHTYWAWARREKWFSQASDNEHPRVRFVTGGWWMASRDVLSQLNYPPEDLHHNGGDTLLGHMLASQGFAIHRYNDGVAINADRDGNESRSERRGITERPYKN